MPLFSSGISSYIKNYVEDLGVNWISTTTAQMSFGFARAANDDGDIVLSGNATLDITVAGFNGLDTGAVAANTWYAVYAIADSTTANPTGAVFSANTSAPTLPAGYDLYRRTQFFRTDASGLLLHQNLFIGRGIRQVAYVDREASTVLALNAGSATSWTSVALASFIPPGVRNAKLIITTDGDADGEHVQVRQASGSVSDPPIKLYAGGTAGRTRTSAQFESRCSTSQAIEYKNSASGNSTSIWVHGYIDSI